MYKDLGCPFTLGDGSLCLIRKSELKPLMAHCVTHIKNPHLKGRHYKDALVSTIRRRRRYENKGLRFAKLFNLASYIKCTEGNPKSLPVPKTRSSRKMVLLQQKKRTPEEYAARNKKSKETREKKAAAATKGNQETEYVDIEVLDEFRDAAFMYSELPAGKQYKLNLV